MIYVWAHSMDVARVDFARPRGLGPPGREWKLVRRREDVVGFESLRDELVVCHTNGYRLTDEQREALEWAQARGYNGTASATHIGPHRSQQDRDEAAYVDRVRHDSRNRRPAVRIEARDRPEILSTEYTATASAEDGERYTSVVTAPRDVDPGFIREQLGRALDVEMGNAILYGLDPETGRARTHADAFPQEFGGEEEENEPVPATWRIESTDLHVDQQEDPVATVHVGYDPADTRMTAVPLRRGGDGHLYRTDAAVAAAIAAHTARAEADPPPVPDPAAAPPTLTEEESMAADEQTETAETRPPDWTEIRITLPPGADVRAVMDSLVAASQLAEDDWCEWIGADGTIASLGPCPAPVAADHPSG